MIRFIGQYIFNLALAFDQAINAVLFGDPDESISGRSGRAIASGRPKWFVPFLARHVDWIFQTFFGETDHVKNAVEPDERPHEKELWSWKREQ
jgi:hypothetical protein